MTVLENAKENTYRRPDFRLFETELRACAQTWTQSAVFARECPNGIAVYSSFGNRSFLELHENANRIANALLAHGLVKGDGIALMSRNRAEFLEVLLAAMRIGLRLTPVNTHLTAPEVTYIVEDCQARIFFIESELASGLAGFYQSSLAPLSVLIRNDRSSGGKDCDSGKASTAQANYQELLNTGSAELPRQLSVGTLMLYTSGTTGRPKGVYRELPEIIEPQFAGTLVNYHPTDVALCCGPAYHAAPLLFDLLEKWDSVHVLELIEAHHVSHAHMVPTMFQRLLSLDSSVRNAYDLTSLRLIAHGAAPCPIATKQAMIEWLGHVLLEYYGATEGGHGINIRSEEWLRKPGAVGKLDPTVGHLVLGNDGEQVAPGTVGRIFFKAPDSGRFIYFGDADKTRSAYQGDHFTLGDLGYVDEEGYLFLTGRAAECIISGGTNIYPQEVDDALLRHPAVADVCTIGAPDDEWGERVVSLVVAAEGYSAGPELASSIMAYAATCLASFKRPRTILFDTELPRSATGKLLRQKVRERFWNEQKKSI
jgi:long-chain acyl-CoA synthetase